MASFRVYGGKKASRALAPRLLESWADTEAQGRQAMKVAVLERFADPSRRCDPEAIVGPEDELAVWNLTSSRNGWRSFVANLQALLAEPISVSDRIRLLIACLNTGGGRNGALARAVELLRRVRAGQIEAIACFSTKDFALAELLAKESGTSCRELLSRQTQYFGEFGFELLAVVPYAYWLHRQGRLQRTIGGLDTRCLYYFSKNHEERPVKRHYVPITEYPVGERGWRGYDLLTFPRVLDTRKWTPAPYREAFRDERFRWEKEICILSNKISDEHLPTNFGPTNFIGTELLLRLIGILRDRYQVIYNRPRASDIATDHQRIHEIGDIEAVERAFPDTVTIQKLHARYPTLSFNELQLRLYSSCRRFVSVLGGSAYLASYFGGTNIVLARRGWEVDCGAYGRWFNLFSGARVVAGSSGRELLQAVEREFLGGASSLR
jgi:hypothetical protein